MNMITNPIHEIKKALVAKQISALELLGEFQKQTEKWNPKVNALITLNENAAKQAQASQDRYQKGQAKPLDGIPIGIKDMLCTEGIRTTAGSKILSNFVPAYSSTVVERLEAAGAVHVGKCNQDEFAMGSTTETSYYGNCRNPWNLDYTPGGSSGGSAAAVAAGFCVGSIGTDTGGSIRQPANFCGLVGVKPTYGRVSRYGIIAYASSLDQAGPMARTVQDAALMLEVMCGHDPKDSTSSKQPVPTFSQHLSENLKGLKIGLPKEYFSDAVSKDTQKVVQAAIESVKKAGAEIVEVSIPLSSLGIPVYYLIATSEASSNLARYDGVRFGYRADFHHKPAEDLAEFYSRTRGEGFGEEVKRRIVLGTYALSSGYYDAYYIKACQVRRLLRQQFLDAYKQCDVLLSPVTTHPAAKLGEKSKDPIVMYLNDIFTISTNLAGLPGMSVPAGFSADGLPIGVQLTAPHFEEQKMLNVALTIEKATEAYGRLPDVF